MDQIKKYLKNSLFSSMARSIEVVIRAIQHGSLGR
jgi:hypothetical protein